MIPTLFLSPDLFIASIRFELLACQELIFFKVLAQVYLLFRSPVKVKVTLLQFWTGFPLISD